MPARVSRGKWAPNMTRVKATASTYAQASGEAGGTRTRAATARAVVMAMCPLGNDSRLRPAVAVEADRRGAEDLLRARAVVERVHPLEQAPREEGRGEHLGEDGEDAGRACEEGDRPGERHQHDVVAGVRIEHRPQRLRPGARPLTSRKSSSSSRSSGVAPTRRPAASTRAASTTSAPDQVASQRGPGTARARRGEPARGRPGRAAGVRRRSRPRRGRRASGSSRSPRSASLRPGRRSSRRSRGPRRRAPCTRPLRPGG